MIALKKMQLARPEFGQALEDGLELRAAFARGDEVTFEGEKPAVVKASPIGWPWAISRERMPISRPDRRVSRL